MNLSTKLGPIYDALFRFNLGDTVKPISCKDVRSAPMLTIIERCTVENEASYDIHYTCSFWDGRQFVRQTGIIESEITEFAK